MDYKFNRRYFDVMNWWFISLVILIGLIMLYFFLFIGILILLAVGSYIFYKLYYKPSETDIDIVYEEEARQAIQQGFEKLSLHPTEVQLIDPIVIHGPFIHNIRFKPSVIKGKDKQVRSSNHEVVVFYFSKDQIYYYKKIFSVIDDEVNETIGEIFYQDIVSIATSSTTTSYYDNLRKRESFFNLDVFELTISGGTTIQCSIKEPHHIEPRIAAMKDVLRRKKSAS